MTCNEVQARLDAYIDGLLDNNEMAKIEKHIQQCESCACELAELRIIVQLLNKLEENDVEKVPKQLHHKLCDIPNKYKNKTNYYKLWGVLAAAIICVLVLTSINPTNLMSKNKMIQDDVDSNMLETVPEEEMVELYGDIERKEEESQENIAEESMMKDSGDIQGETIKEREAKSFVTDGFYLEVSEDIEAVTNLIVRQLQNLEFEVVESEPGRITLVGINQEDIINITEQLKKNGRLVQQLETVKNSTVIIYLVNE